MTNSFLMTSCHTMCAFLCPNFVNLFNSNKKGMTNWDKCDVKTLLLMQKSKECQNMANNDLVVKGLGKLDINLTGIEVLDKSDDTSKNNSNSDVMYPHEDESKWFLPKCNRINAEKLLKGRRDGTFLVRGSSQLDGKYVLSIVIKGHIKHIVIQKNESGYCLCNDVTHPTLFSLIMFYAQPFDQQLDSAINSCQSLHFPVFQ